MTYIFLSVMNSSLSRYPAAATALEKEARAFFGRLPLSASCRFQRLPLNRAAQESTANGGRQS